MAIISKEIMNATKLQEMNLRIPDYQRPYKWTEKNVNQLFNDILQAAQKELSQYRLGTIVIHEHEDGRRDLVDGQQRTITLHLIQHVLEGIPNLQVKQNNSHIGKNYREIKRLYKSLSLTQKGVFRTYFKENCYVITIVIDNEMEAFQFFDSQNARGKALEAHDLLKAYHLREMNGDSEKVKLTLIERWESQMTSELASLFKRYLYRIKMWIKWEDAHHFHHDGVDIFKGIPMNEQFTYVQFQKAAYLFIEKFNRENNQELLGIDQLIPFQIDQAVLAGRRFFEATLYYIDLKRRVEKIALAKVPQSVSPKYGKEQLGTRYVRELFQLLLLYYYDRFGIERRNKMVEEMFFTYSYQLRLLNQAVYETSINKYALGYNDRLNKGINFFSIIKDATLPSDIEKVIIDQLHYDEMAPKYQSEKYKDLREALEVKDDA